MKLGESRAARGVRGVDGAPVIFTTGSRPPELVGESKYFSVDNLRSKVCCFEVVSVP